MKKIFSVEFIRKLLILFIGGLFFFGLVAVGEVVDGRKYRTLTFFESQDFSADNAGADSLFSEWFPLGNYQYFNAYLDLAAVGTTFGSSLAGDSLHATIYLEEHPGESRPSGDVGYYPFSGSPLTFFTLATSDTTKKYQTAMNLRLHQSLHISSPAIAPGAFGRIVIAFAATHVHSTGKLTLNSLKLFVQP